MRDYEWVRQSSSQYSSTVPEGGDCCTGSSLHPMNVHLSAPTCCCATCRWVPARLFLGSVCDLLPRRYVSHDHFLLKFNHCLIRSPLPPLPHAFLCLLKSLGMSFPHYPTNASQPYYRYMYNYLPHQPAAYPHPQNPNYGWPAPNNLAFNHPHHPHHPYAHIPHYSHVLSHANPGHSAYAPYNQQHFAAPHQYVQQPTPHRFEQPHPHNYQRHQRRPSHRHMDRYVAQARAGSRLPLKTVYLVRHGESTHNAQSHSYRRVGYNDASYLDAPLTLVGRGQAARLVHHLPTLDIELVVASPLRRATQTCFIATEKMSQPLLPLIHPLCIERLATAGDIGTPVSVLEKKYQYLDYSRLSPEDCWWWSPVGAQSRGQMESLKLLWKYQGSDRGMEPKDHFMKRVNDFRLWLLQRPETTIIVFSHGVFLMHLMGDRTTGFDNGEIRKLIL